MPNKGATTFKKRQKEMERKERQQDKFAKRMGRKNATGETQAASSDEPSENENRESTPDSGQSVVA